MRLIIRCISVVMLFVGMSGVANATSHPTVESRAEMISKWMKEKLELTVDQMPKVKALNLKYEKEIDQLVHKKDGFSCMQAVRDTLKKKEKELAVVFTNEQLEAYRKCKCELKEELKRSAQYNN